MPISGRGISNGCQECFLLVVSVPRQKCAREGCENIASNKAGQKYCSVECWELCADYDAMQKKALAVIKAHKEITGETPRAERRSNAVRRNNKTKPPRSKVKRKDKAYGYEVIFEPEQGENGMQYRASVSELPGIITRHREKNKALLAIRRMMREQGLATMTRRVM